MERTPTDLATAQLLADGAIAAARTGNPGAVETVVNHTYPLVQRFLRFLADDPSIADDLTQDVMFSAVRHLPDLSNDASLMPWLYQMARNALNSHGRRRMLRPTDSLEQWMDRASSNRDIIEPVSAITEIEDDACVQQLLAPLQPADRELIYLRHVAGLTAAEIAGVLGISHATARQRIHRAVKIMRQQSQVMPSNTMVPNAQREATNAAT
jgi:RNA polymerase sigma-70 factor (ECF subfamily)